MARALAPQFLSLVAGAVVAVDRLQPVAALLSPSGVLLDVASWGDQRDAPPDWVWPIRRVATGADRVVVQDLPDSEPVALVVGAGRFERVESAPDTGPAWRHPRFFTAVPRTVCGWTFAGRRTADRWWSWVERDGHRWTAGDGSFVARAVTETWAVAAVRRAPVRPWAFEPEHELVALAARPEGPVPARVRTIDVTEHCWTRRPDVDLASNGYLNWSENLAREISSHGGEDVRLAVDGADVDIHFSRGGTRYVVHDEPFDEVGRVVGLRFWGTGVDDWSAPPASLIVG